jgi:Tfp pilus assembly PilM family ATPase
MVTALRTSDEIPSTVPGLEAVRDGGDDSAHLAEPSAPTTKGGHLGKLCGRIRSYRKQVVIGVDFSDHAVRLAKISTNPQTQHTLADCTIASLPSDMAFPGSELADFLRATLNDFCADAPRPEIWTAVTSAQVETRYLRIPKVPKRQLAKAVFWTYRREAPFDEAVSLFGFDLVGELNDRGVRKYEVMAYTVPVAEVREIQRLFNAAGYPLTGVTIIPFSLQNVLQANWLGSSDQPVCTLFIGREFSRIDIFENNHMILSRVIKAGVRSMLDTLKENLVERRLDDPIELDTFVPVDQLASIELTSLEKQEESLVGHLAQRLNMGEEDVLDMMLPAMERLIGQVERTLKHYALNFDNKQVDGLYIFGEVDIHPRIVELFSDQFGIPSHIIDFFADQPLSINVPAPRVHKDRYQLIPAIALALSTNGKTPNFLFTHDDKVRMARFDIINKILAVGTAMALLLIAGISFVQKHNIHLATAQIAELQQRLEQDPPRVDRKLINKLADQAQTKAAKERRAAAKSVPLALLSELSALTSEEIHLLEVDAELFGKSSGKSNNETPVALTLKGLVTGTRLGLDVSLAAYIINLNASPLFSQAVVEERSMKNFEEKPAIFFTVRLNLEQAS